MAQDRTLIKFIRDKVKSSYVYKSCCEICGSSENLELHHYYTIFFLVEEFLKEYGDILDKEDFRNKFIERYKKELIELTVTLCEPHHTLLHKIYGAKPALFTATKQMTWVGVQNNKANGIVVESRFSKFKV